MIPSKNTILQLLIFFTLFEIFLWMFIAIYESSFSIIFFHLILLVFLIPILYKIKKTAFYIFSLSLFLRSIFTITAWFVAPFDARKYHTGTNEDSERFWESAKESLNQATGNFEDDGFSYINSVLYQFSEVFGSASYLVNVQNVVFSGALMAAFSYLFVYEVYKNKNIALTTAIIMSISPINISFSTGLMRDSLIGMFGIIFLYLFIKAINHKNSFRKLLLVFISFLSITAIFYLRSVSFFAFLGCAVAIMIFSKKFIGKMNFSNMTFYLISIPFLSVISYYFFMENPERIQEIFLYQYTARMGLATDGMILMDQVNETGITNSLYESSPFLLALISPYVYWMPMPFYSWEAPIWNPGPNALIDILIGFGGLFNQILFYLYAYAIYIWVRNNDGIGISLGFIFSTAICSLILIGFGQIRMAMSHIYVFYYMGIAISIFSIYSNSRSFKEFRVSLFYWICTLVLLYISYYLYTIGVSIFYILPFFITSLIFILLNFYLLINLKILKLKDYS